MNNIPKTVKGQQSRELILSTALRLFLKFGYEKATISQIIENSGMSRGSIFYYYPDKFSLYKEVVERYILSAHRISVRLGSMEEPNLWNFIHVYAESIGRLIAELSKIPEYNPITYFNMTFQAALYYPGFQEKVAEIFREENEIWRKVIVEDMARGNLRADLSVDYLIHHFRHCYLGMSVEAGFFVPLEPEKLLELYKDVYRRIEA